MHGPTNLPHTLLEQLQRLLPTERIKLEAAERWPYGGDNSRRHALPDAVLFPINHEEVEAITAACYQHRIPLVVRGRGTATTGASVPVAGGIILSTERLNKILRIDPANRLMVVQPGVTNQEVQQAAAQHGFFWPPDPTSAAVCTIGGNLACNAAGPHAVKYGTTRDNVLGLRMVTGQGQSLHSGVSTTKGVVGYDLTRLVIGSEGTLAIITEATLKLIPKPAATRTMRLLYSSISSAAAAISRIMAQPTTPYALEFMDNQALSLIRDRLNDVPDACQALLMLEIDGAEPCLPSAIDAITLAAQGEGCIEIKVAQDKEDVAQLWEARKALSPTLRAIAPKKINEDIVVPVSRMAELVDGVTRLGREHDITIVNFGHAGNGNIHVNLLVNPDDAGQMARAERCLDQLFTLVLALGGTLSGEHGIGLVKREFISRELEENALKLMRAIKRQFDPEGILNPGKWIA